MLVLLYLVLLLLYNIMYVTGLCLFDGLLLAYSRRLYLTLVLIGSYKLTLVFSMGTCL